MVIWGENLRRFQFLSAQVFDVVVQETEGSKRLNLENCGQYKLYVTMASIGLGDYDKREVKVKWRFEYIRRYGFHSRTLFSLEAGRRCETGEGFFNFLVHQNQEHLTSALDKATGVNKEDEAFSVKFKFL